MKEIVRTRLISRIGVESPARLTLLTAPAGYGKSRLLRQWEDRRRAAGYDDRVVTVTDGEPVRFVRRLLAALVPEEAYMSDPRHGPDPVEALTTVLVAAPKSPRALIVDNFELVTEEETQLLMGRLIGYAAAEYSFVLSSREAPRFPLARLRAQGSLTEIRSEELAFSRAELGAARSLIDATGGWPFAVSLLANGATTVDSARSIEAFLREEILGRFDTPEVRALAELTQPAISGAIHQDLVKTIFVEILDGDADDLIRRARDASILLDRAGPDLLEIHPVFEPLLSGFPAARENRQSRRTIGIAAEWFEKSGDPANAIKLYLAVDRIRDAERLLGACAGDMRDEATRAGIADLFQKRDSDEVPGLNVSILLAGTELSAGRLSTARLHLENARRAATDAPDIDGTTRGRLALLRSSLAILDGQPADARDALEEAHRHLGIQRPVWLAMAETSRAVAALWSDEEGPMAAIAGFGRAKQLAEAGANRFVAEAADFQRAVAMRVAGEIDQAAQILNGLVDAPDATALRYPSVTGPAGAELAFIALERDEQKPALAMIEEAISETAVVPSILARWWTFCNAIWINLHCLGPEAARQPLGQLNRLRRDGQVPPGFRIIAAALEGRILEAEEDRFGLQKWIERRGLDLAPPVGAVREAELIVHARTLLGRGADAEARQLLDRLAAFAAKSGRGYTAVEIGLLRAEALYRLGERNEALNGALGALHGAERGRLLRSALDRRTFLQEIAADLHREIRLRGIPYPSASFIDRVAMKSPYERQGAREATHYELPEPLSPREVEVLRALEDGATNTEIAEMLFVSLNTVKTHLKNIYGKLGTCNRTETVALARRIHLL